MYKTHGFNVTMGKVSRLNIYNQILSIKPLETFLLNVHDGIIFATGIEQSYAPKQSAHSQA